jgi:hypothetical protein
LPEQRAWAALLLTHSTNPFTHKVPQLLSLVLVDSLHYPSDDLKVNVTLQSALQAEKTWSNG